MLWFSYSPLRVKLHRYLALNIYIGRKDSYIKKPIDQKYFRGLQ